MTFAVNERLAVGLVQRTMGALVLAVLMLGMSRSCPAQSRFLDTETGCLQCHITPIRNNDFCKLASADIWEKHDKHGRAFKLLYEGETDDPQQAQAKRELVRNILGFELREAFVDDQMTSLRDGNDAETVRKVSTVKACLRCHATWPASADGAHPNVPPVKLQLGVSCQACHGPSQKWDGPHREETWRLVTPEAKSQLGFIDVRTPVAKAKLCASCHVGDLAEERFVRHEWYAGGHPPLPSFEIASFEAQMPVHWNTLREKGAFAYRDGVPEARKARLEADAATLVSAGIPREAIKSSYIEANFPRTGNETHHPALDLARMKNAVVGGAVVMQTYAKLVGDYAALASEDKAVWPELAIYDCSACHHELRNNLGLRNRPVRRTPPGRPPLANWPLPLAHLATQQAARFAAADADLHWSALMEAHGKLEQAATVRPFGNPAAMREAAPAVIEQWQKLALAAAAAPYDEPAARRALAFLAEKKLDLNDFASARQIGWGAREIATDLGVPDARTMFLRDDADVLALDLPSGANRSLLQNLGPWLAAASQYDPDWFRSRLEELAQRVGK